MADANSIRSSFNSITFLADAFQGLHGLMKDDDYACSILFCLNEQLESALAKLDGQLCEAGFVDP